ncbi:MAG: glycosyltransferase family 39 protein [Actinobacteria bacterium]|nr:glycosyltransferase family 39 protein [Actinomycetota bacterium]
MTAAETSAQVDDHDVDATAKVDMPSRRPTQVDPRDDASIARSTAFRVGIQIVVLTAVVWRLWTMSAWGFFQDDVVYISRVGEMPFWSFITQNYNGHAMPAQFAIIFGLTRLAPYVYDPAAVVLTVFMTSAVVAWVLALRELFGERLRIVVVAAVLAFSPIFMQSALWWASGMQVYPLLTFMGLAVLFAARYSARFRTSDLVLMNVMLVLGLAFWQKALLIVIPTTFIALLLTRARGRSVWKSLRWLLLTQGVVCVVYLGAYLVFRTQPDQSHTEVLQSRGILDAVGFFGTALIEILAPALLGGPWSVVDNPLSVFPGSAGIQSVVVIGAAIATLVLASRLRPMGRIAIWMVVTYAAISWGLLLTSSRFAAVGTSAVQSGRHTTDVLPIAMLAVLFFVTPLRAEAARHWVVPASRLVRSGVKVVAVLTAAGIFTSLAVTNARMWDRLALASPGPWLEHFVQDSRDAGDRSVYDSLVSERVLSSIFFPHDARLSTVVKPLNLSLRFNQPAHVLLVADDEGRLKEVEVSPDSRAVTPSPVPDCGYLVKPGETALIPLTNAMFEWDWGVQLDYFTAKPGTLLVRSTDQLTEVPVRAGLNSEQFVLVDSVSMFAVSATSASGAVCITDLKVGGMKPTDRGVEQADS